MSKGSKSSKRKPRKTRKAIGTAVSPAAQKRINIFISYASEDTELVGNIVNLLKLTFQFAPLYIFRDIEIREGQNYANKIDQALDEADILLVILTDRRKMSHSYTGYEVGYFNRSIQESPKGGAGFERIYIPFCIGADIPDALHFIQGVSVGNDEVYKVPGTKIKDGTDPIVDEDNPVFKLLARVSDLVMQIVGARTINLAKPASDLYRIIHEYLQSRISSETYPERKLIIRTATRPEIAKEGVDLTKASVELVGDFLEIFSISLEQSIGRQYSWPAFCEKIPAELRSGSVAGIQQLTTAILKGGGDNYHVVTTAKRDKSFRLFVSKVITYVSQKTEVDIYIVQMITKDYGDPQTTRLLKSISVGLRFRFLVLEEKSDFRPEKLGHPIVTAPILKTRVTEMLGQMDLILREAAEAELDDPELLILIWGRGQEEKVQAMMDIWKKTLQQLYSAADEVLNSVDDDSFNRKKESFVQALAKFCADVEEMNREFTSRVLSLLAEHVKGDLTKQGPSMPSNDRGAIPPAIPKTIGQSP